MNTIGRLFLAVVINVLGFMCYVGLQEFYVENCTWRVGLISMFTNMPTCNWVLSGLEFIGKHYVSLIITSVGLIGGFIF